MAKEENVLIIKGYGSPHEDRWQEDEATLAKEAGLNVVYPPDIPEFVDGTPTIQIFQDYIWELIQKASLDPELTTVLAHSLGGNGWMHLLKQRSELKKAMTVVLGTPLNNDTGVEEVDEMFPTPDLNLTESERQRFRVVGSDNDSIIHEHPSILAGHLGVEPRVIPGAGHFMPHALPGADKSALDLGKKWREIRAMIIPY